MTDIKKFVRKIMELQDEDANRPFTQEELREIAGSLGMSDEDWAGVQEEAKDHCTRGVGYLRHGLWFKAAREFEQALILLPGDADVLYGLAEAHCGLFFTKSQSMERQKAIDYATRCLEEQPDNERAFTLLSMIENAEKTQVPEVGPRRNPIKGQNENSDAWGCISPFLVIIGSLGIIFVLLSFWMSMFKACGS